MESVGLLDRSQLCGILGSLKFDFLHFSFLLAYVSGKFPSITLNL